MNQKQCRKCLVFFSATTEFFPRGNGPFGLAAYCKPCKREITRQWMSIPANKASHRHKNREWHRRMGAEYKAWEAMKDRCRNPNNSEYPNYGGRGIGVCAAWAESFAAFLADMGPRPSGKHSIDRIDSNADYFPLNCRWATTKQQARNKRTSHLLTLNGKTQTVADWCEEIGLKYNTVAERIRRYGWTVEQALTLKPQKGKKP